MSVLVKGSGGFEKVTVNGVPVRDRLNLKSLLLNFESKALPYNFQDGSAVLYNGEVHILGGYVEGTSKNHYKFNGETWEKVSDLPYAFYSGAAVVFDGKIHILGGGAADAKRKHYVFDGTTWETVSTLPSDFYCGQAVVFRGEIHTLGTFGAK